MTMCSHDEIFTSVLKQGGPHTNNPYSESWWMFVISNCTLRQHPSQPEAFPSPPPRPTGSLSNFRFHSTTTATAVNKLI